MQTIETHYLGPTKTQNPRIVATTESGNRLVTNCNSAVDNEQNHQRAARLLKTELTWHAPMIGGYTKHGMAWVFIDHSPVI